MSTKRQWGLWLLATIGLTGYLAYSLLSQPSIAAKTFLPGVTTHGHYQIELQCQECHSPGMGVLQDACTKCHGEELEQATDTHPRSKFTDPGKAHLVKGLDARSCLTCHREHVPDRTHAMGLSLPTDYCWHCHQEIAEQRPSHKDFAYDSCATAGCHNYHDNRALFENYLVSHHGEPDMLDEQRVPARTFGEVWRQKNPDRQPLTGAQHNAPEGVAVDPAVLDEWATTAHARGGVNCADCHVGDNGAWFDKVSHETCQQCHDSEVEGFLAGRHGMRLSVGLAAMTPADARLPMNHERLHSELNCSACHKSHRFDTQYAAADACLTCHDDEHSRAYEGSAHHELWRQELAGESPAGTGVSCATCHMPRQENDDGRIFVQHNQNANLRPNEKMVRTVCTSCHGLQFTLDSLADGALVANNFRGRPEGRVASIDLAKAWEDERRRLREARQQARREKTTTNDQADGGN